MVQRDNPINEGGDGAKLLFALRNHHIQYNYPTQVFDDERLKRILRGAEWVFVVKPPRERRAKLWKTFYR